MKKIIPLLLFLFVSVSYSGDLPGLDSLDLGDEVEIVMIEKSIYSGENDSTSVYVKLIENDKYERPEMWIYREKESDGIAHLFGDSATYYFKNEGEYNRFKSNYFDGGNNEIMKLYDLAYRNFHFSNHISVANHDIIINRKSLISPSEGMIKTDFEIVYTQMDSKILETIHVDVLERDELLYSFSYFRGGKEIEQLNLNYIFKKSENDSIFEIMDSFIKDSVQNYTQKEPKKREKRIIAALGDTLDIDYEFLGVSGESVNLKQFLIDHDYAIIYTWGTWCGPCIFNTDNVKKFNNEYNSPGFFTLIHEHGRASLEQKKQYVSRKKVPYPVYTNEDFVKSNNLYSFPTFLVLDKEGIIIDIQEGTSKDGEYLYEEFIKYRNN